MHLWRSDYSSFIRYAQYDCCRRLIVVPLTTFHRLAELIGDPKGELIFLFNTARCGSTLLVQVHDHQGRLNQWAHGARAGPRIFFLFEGPPTGCGEIIF